MNLCTNLLGSKLQLLLVVFAVCMAVGSSSSSKISPTKHPLEDSVSWKNHLGRQSLNHDGSVSSVSSTRSRTLLEAASASGTTSNVQWKPEDDDKISNDDVDWNIEVKHKKPKKHIPFAGGDTTHGMMIDAGSQGTRLHVYEWKKRFLLDEEDLLEQMRGKKLSYPTSNNRWTDKYTPGLDVFAELSEYPDRLEEEVSNYLGPLIDFAKEVLRDKEDEWHTYPIYLKATGGLRTLPQPQRVQLIAVVRKLFHNTTFNPFDFGSDERARVISGEEEAIYGWVGVNFAKGVLIDESKGSGVGLDPALTYGMLEMGGASTQIANFENNGDLMANLFKLQLGGSRHWNVYVHSYLYFGINGAWSRFNSRLHSEGKTTNPCLPLGSSVEFDSWMHMNDDAQFYPRSDPRSTPYSVTMVNNGTTFDYADCAKHANDLLRKRTNRDWCDFQMDGNCGFAGIYQPPLPKVKSSGDKFIATSNFADVYQFLQLPEKSYVREIGIAAERVCRLGWEELKTYNAENEHYTIKGELELAQMCFRSVFVYELLTNGWEFGDDYKMTAVDVIDGQKMGWALGCMLYEINTLPWDFHPEFLYRGPKWYVITLYIIVGTLAGLGVGFVIAMRFNKRFNKTVRESLYFRTHPEFVSNPVVRKSLSLPDYGGDLDELNELYQADQAEESKNNGASVKFADEKQTLLGYSVR